MSTSPTLLEAVWEHREEVLYRELFADTGEGIYPLPAELFAERFGQACDPRWLTIGVFECPPGASRSTWVYVSSGLSNPWEEDFPPADPATPSGLGVEYVFNTTAQADWAIELVQYVTAYDLLLAHGRFPDRKGIFVGDRIPVQIRDRGGDRLSLIRKLMVVEPEFIPARHRLDSGELRILHLVGITEPEGDFAQSSGTEALCERLRQADALAVTDPWRQSLV